MPKTDLLKGPVITEKMTDMTDKHNVYGFIVEREANKLMIKAAVEEMYGVSVEKVRTVVVPGKSKSRHTKTGIMQGHAPSYKKAYVTLLEGDTIDFFSNV